MTMKIRTGALGIGLSFVMLTSCQGSGAFASLQQTLSQLEQNQQQIIAEQKGLASRFEALERAGTRPAAPTGRPRPSGPDANAVYRVAVGDAHFKGPADAKITIVQWSDFQCPFCARIEPTIDEVMKTYNGDVRVAFKHNPLASIHPRAEPAALAAEAAGRQGKFWEMHAKLFANSKALTDENFVKWAQEIGLDIVQFNKDIADPALKATVAAMQKEAIGLGARATPAFFINGRFLNGAVPFEQFKKLIEAELKKADALIAKGVPRDEAYEETIKNGRTG